MLSLTFYTFTFARGTSFYCLPTSNKDKKVSPFFACAKKSPSNVSGTSCFTQKKHFSAQQFSVWSSCQHLCSWFVRIYTQQVMKTVPHGWCWRISCPTFTESLPAHTRASSVSKALGSVYTTLPHAFSSFLCVCLSQQDC